MASVNILSFFTNQLVEWRAAVAGSWDKQGQPAYQPPVQIRARITAGREFVGDILGKGVKADCAIMTQRRVNVFDLITYEGVTYKMTEYAQVPWVGGQYMGRFLLGERLGTTPRTE
jgi:hypothetical protein